MSSYFTNNLADFITRSYNLSSLIRNMGMNSHNFYEPLMVSISNNGDLKPEPNYDMNLLNNELINMTLLRTGGQKI